MYTIKRKDISSWTLVFFAILLITLLGAFFIHESVSRRSFAATGNMERDDARAQEWRIYTDSDFGFRMEYPSQWAVARVGGELPVITFYKKGTPEAGAAPFNVDKNATHVSIYPIGAPERPSSLGEKFPSRLPIEGASSAMDYVLHDGMPYASEFTFARVPPSWKPEALLFARVRTSELQLTCLRGTEKMPLKECDARRGDRMLRRGTISVADRAVEERMLRTFSFTITK